jgi:hypothetical protein|tara:strand:- start:1797 stop:2783 length:987 start_codon:yes stop_codon:yes gene_type:complete
LDSPQSKRLKPNKVPTGKDILNPDWPDATWDIGVLFVHDNDVFNVLESTWRQYKCMLPIRSVFGCYNVQWSGGRNSCNSLPWNYTGWTPERLIKGYNDRGIGCTFTFANTLLEKEHLTDPSSNYLLDLLAKQEYEGNAVTVACDILSDYIRGKYPNLKQKASIVKITTEMPQRRTFEYYESLLGKYDATYLHPDDNLNLGLLEKIAQSGKIDRYEPLMNERCTINCSIRKDHYDEISRCVIDGWHGMFNFTNVDLIHNPDHPNSICERRTRPETRSCTLSKAEFKEIYDLGFRTFKLQGRDTNWEAMLYNFSVWVLEPDFIAERFFVG